MAAERKNESRFPSAYTVPMILYLVGMALFIALLTEQWAMTYLCVMVFSMTAGARAWSVLGLARIRSALRADKKRMFPDEPLALSVEVENDKPLPVWLQVTVPLGEALRAVSGAAQLKQDSGLLSYQRVLFEWQAAALGRGVHTVGPVEIEAGDPLGFFPRKKKRKSSTSSSIPAWSA